MHVVQWTYMPEAEWETALGGQCIHGTDLIASGESLLLQIGEKTTGGS